MSPRKFVVIPQASFAVQLFDENGHFITREIFATHEEAARYGESYVGHPAGRLRLVEPAKDAA